MHIFKMISSVYGKVIMACTAVVILIAFVFVFARLVGVETYIVKSGSMEPTIHVGALAFVNTRDKNPEKEDIITYSIKSGDAETIVTHRVIEIKENGTLTTKGDANDITDFIPVNRQQVLGTYLFNVPKIGFWAANIGKREILLFINAILVLNLFAMLLSNLVREGERRREEENGDSYIEGGAKPKNE